MTLKLTGTPEYIRLGPPGPGFYAGLAALMGSRMWWEIATKPSERTSWWACAIGSPARRSDAFKRPRLSGRQSHVKTVMRVDGLSSLPV